jgi:hypothetical protein
MLYTDRDVYREQIGENVFRCKFCSQIFDGNSRNKKSAKDQISCHYAAKHKYVCEVCKRNLSYRANYNKHMEEGNGSCPSLLPESELTFCLRKDLFDESRGGLIFEIFIYFFFV